MHFNRMKIGIVGIGKMGQNHLKELEYNPAFDITAMFDLRQFTAKYPLFNDMETFLDKELDIVIIATPTSTHLELGRQIFKRVKVVLIEKPLALNLAQMLEIKTLAQNYNTKVAVGLIERFNPVILHLKECLKNEEIISINIRRFSPYPNRINDCGILQDLGVHDIDLLQFLSNKNIIETNIKKLFIRNNSKKRGGGDEAIISCRLENEIIASIHQSWNSPYKQRSIIVITRFAIYEADLLQFLLFKNLQPLKLSSINSPLYGEHNALLNLALNKGFGNLADINTAISIQQVLESNQSQL